jgi:hypothetical protein
MILSPELPQLAEPAEPAEPAELPQLAVPAQLSRLQGSASYDGGQPDNAVDDGAEADERQTPVHLCPPLSFSSPASRLTITDSSRRSEFVLRSVTACG